MFAQERLATIVTRSRRLRFLSANKHEAFRLRPHPCTSDKANPCHCDRVGRGGRQNLRPLRKTPRAAGPTYTFCHREGPRVHFYEKSVRSGFRITKSVLSATARTTSRSRPQQPTPSGRRFWGRVAARWMALRLVWVRGWRIGWLCVSCGPSRHTKRNLV